jgi:hypothetical protein
MNREQLATEALKLGIALVEREPINGEFVKDEKFLNMAKKALQKESEE